MTLAPQFTHFRASIMSICPPFLQGNWGERYLYTAAVHLDAMADWLIEGVKARMPGVGTPEALPYIGADRVIERGFSESDDAYAARLSVAFDSWSIAGNPIAVITQLVGYLSPAVPKIRYVITGLDLTTSQFVTQWVTLEAGAVTLHRADPYNWQWDGDAVSSRARFWVIVYPGVGFFDDRKLWGDGHSYGDGTAWGYVGSANLAADIRRIVEKWKQAGSVCVYTILAADAGDFDPTASIGDAGMPDGSWDAPANRLDTALYIPGAPGNP